MSLPIDSTDPEIRGVLRGTSREIRRRGSAFGVSYDFGIRIMTLSDAEMETASSPLLTAPAAQALLKDPLAP